MVSSSIWPLSYRRMLISLLLTLNVVVSSFLRSRVEAGGRTWCAEDCSAGAGFVGLTVVNPFASQVHGTAAGYAVKPKAGGR